MSHALINTAVGVVLFAVGMGWTVRRYARQDRTAFMVVAVISPVLAVWAVLQLIYRVCMGKSTLGPCPAGLSEAERAVEMEKQRMFGGELREPTFARNWKRAYDLQLERDAESVKRAAERVLVHA